MDNVRKVLPKKYNQEFLMLKKKEKAIIIIVKQGQ